MAEIINHVDTRWAVILYGVLFIVLVVYFKKTGKRVKELETLLRVLCTRLTPILQLIAAIAGIIGKIYVKKEKRSKNKDE